MREGWEVKELEKLAKVYNGNSINAKEKSENYVGLESGTPFVATKDVSFNHQIDYNNGVLIPVPKSSEFKIAPINSVLVCAEGGSAGRKIAHNDRNINFGNKLFAIVPDATVDSKFIFYYCITNDFYDAFSEKMVGIIGGVSLKKFKNLLFPLAPLPEQKRIVAILDEAFEGIDRAIANAKKNLANVRELFQATINNRLFGDADQKGWTVASVASLALSEKGSIRTGPFGSQLLHNEFVNEGIAVLGIDNAVVNKFQWGKRRFITPEKYKQLSRYTVNHGDVLITIMGTCGRCAIVPDDIPVAINTKHLCCISLDRTKCIPEYLHAYFLYHPIAQDFLLKRAKGSIMSGLNMGIIKELPVRLPNVDEQFAIVIKIQELQHDIESLESIYKRKLSALAELKQSLLQKAFSGELTEFSSTVNIISFPKAIPNISTTDLHAGILAIAYQQHENIPKYRETFGHVKAEKIAHMVEACAGINLDRNPIKDAAGPNDFHHLKKVESRARKAGFFNFNSGKGERYSFKKSRRFNDIIEKTRVALGENLHGLNKIIELMLPMDTRQAEIFATVYAAWNNLLIRNEEVSDEAIVYEARENWHKNKLGIPRPKFFKAIEWIREIDMIPKGKGKLVAEKAK